MKTIELTDNEAARISGEMYYDNEICAKLDKAPTIHPSTALLAKIWRSVDLPADLAVEAWKLVKDHLP